MNKWLEFGCYGIDLYFICIVKEMFGSKVYNDIVNILYSRKILKAYYGFRVLYVFPFPSAGHWPKGGSGRDN